MKTVQPKVNKIVGSWHLIDAKGQVLGRLATKVAGLLMGKSKVDYAPQADMGDNVVVLNASEVVVTGRKSTNKLYRRHSGYPGGFKELSYDQMMAKNPTKVIELAVSGMLPDNRLKKVRMARLTISANSVNPEAGKFK